MISNSQFNVLRQGVSMHYIGVHQTIVRMMSVFYSFGIWQTNNRCRFRSWCLRLWYLGAYGYVVIAIAVGALTTDNESEVVFLAVLSIVAFVLEIRMYFFLWKRDDILGFIRKMGVHTIRDDDEFRQVKGKIEFFIKFVSYFEVMLVCAVVTMTIIALPIFSTEKQLPLHYYFPFQWQHNQILYCIAYTFVTYGLMLTCLCTLFNAIIWYLMMSCAIKYLILGNEFRRLGSDGETEGKVVDGESVGQQQDFFLLELIALIKKHKELDETTDQFKSFFSNIFFIQIATSGLAICGSVYALAFSSMENPFQYGVYVASMLYSFFDIFMVTYFGNEIKYASSQLSSCLFFCNWVDQSKTSKKCMLIVKEVLKQPQELVIGKLYPLDLDAFSKILNFAYSQFNLLKNIQF